MRIERLFHVLVVAGASATVGIAGCSDDDGGSGGDEGDGGSSGSTGGTSSGGTTGSTGGASGSSSGGSTSTGGTSSGGSPATGGTSNTGGASTGGASATGGAAPSMDGGMESGVQPEAGAEGGGDSCEAVCVPNPIRPRGADWTNCNGCCCWLDPPARPSPAGGVDICGDDEPCCIGRGR